MNVLLTGSTGFIGQATAEWLRDQGHEVSEFDRSLGLDVRDPIACYEAMASCDAVIHLAGVLGTAELFDEVDRAIAVNMAGTANIVAAAHRAGSAYVGITMPPVFPSIYTATKVGAQRIAEAYHHAHGLRVTHIKAFNVYGPGQAHGEGHPQKIVPTFAANAWRSLPMPVWGDGSQAVDLVHVDHVAKCLGTAATATGGDFGQCQTFDAGSGVEMTVTEVAREIGRYCGSTLVEFLPMRAGEIPQRHLVAESVGPLGFGKHLDLLAETVEAYRPAKSLAA